MKITNLKDVNVGDVLMPLGWRTEEKVIHPRTLHYSWHLSFGLYSTFPATEEELATWLSNGAWFERDDPKPEPVEFEGEVIDRRDGQDFAIISVSGAPWAIGRRVRVAAL